LALQAEQNDLLVLLAEQDVEKKTLKNRFTIFCISFIFFFQNSKILTIKNKLKVEEVG